MSLIQFLIRKQTDTWENHWINSLETKTKLLPGPDNQETRVLDKALSFCGLWSRLKMVVNSLLYPPWRGGDLFLHHLQSGLSTELFLTTRCIQITASCPLPPPLECSGHVERKPKQEQRQAPAEEKRGDLPVHGPAPLWQPCVKPSERDLLAPVIDKSHLPWALPQTAKSCTTKISWSL